MRHQAKEMGITGARFALAGLVIVFLCLHSGTASADSVKEKRLRAWYCLGSINYMIPLAEVRGCVRVSQV